MGSFKDLPLEILFHIFGYLEKMKVVVNMPNTQHLEVPGVDLFKCQLTCQQWMQPAQQIIYKDIYIRGLQQLERFIESMNRSKTKPSYMADSIYIYNSHTSLDSTLYAILFSNVQNLYPNIKAIYTNKVPSNYFWSALMKERYQGHLKALKTIPAASKHNLDGILHYELAVSALQETICNLIVYDWLPTKDLNFVNLKLFKNLKKLEINLEDYRNVFKIDKQIPHNLETISIGVELVPRYVLDSAPIADLDSVDLSLVKSSNNVKNLRVKSVAVNERVIDYLMRMLPKLNNLNLSFVDPHASASRPVATAQGLEFQALSTKFAFRYLDYLNVISYFDVINLVVENPSALLSGFFPKLMAIKLSYHLSHRIYDGNSNPCYLHLTGANPAKYQNTWPLGDKNRFFVDVNYWVRRSTDYYPHKQLIEKFGKDLKTVKIDMGEDDFGLNRNTNMNSASNGGYVDHIFQHCPNLYELDLMSTGLFTYASAEGKNNNRIASKGCINLKNASISSEFLRHLSSRCGDLHQLKIIFCEFAQANGDILANSTNITINMPSTSIYKIVYEDKSVELNALPKFYIKLAHLDRHVIYLVGDASTLDSCSEEDYEKSLNSFSSLSIFIQCACLEMLRLNTPDYNLYIALENGREIYEKYPIQHVREDGYGMGYSLDEDDDDDDDMPDEFDEDLDELGVLDGFGAFDDSDGFDEFDEDLM